MRKLKFYNPYIQTLCLIIGILGLSNVNFFVSLINIPRIYWQLFFALFILLFLVRKAATSDTVMMSKYRVLAEDIMSASISFLLLGFAGNCIINLLCIISLSSKPTLTTGNSSLPWQNTFEALAWITLPLIMIFIIAVGFWSFMAFKKIGISKISYYSFAAFYTFAGIMDIRNNINSHFPSIVLFYTPFLIMLVIGICLLFGELIKRHLGKLVSLRKCSVAGGIDDTMQ